MRAMSAGGSLPPILAEWVRQPSARAASISAIISSGVPVEMELPAGTASPSAPPRSWWSGCPARCPAMSQSAMSMGDLAYPWPGRVRSISRLRRSMSRGSRPGSAGAISAMANRAPAPKAGR